MDLSKINKISRVDSFLPTKKFAELEPGKTYKITEMKMIKTTFGVKVIVGLNNEYSVFLPERISKFLQEHTEQFQELAKASAENHLYMRHIDGKYNQCEFSYV